MNTPDIRTRRAFTAYINDAMQGAAKRRDGQRLSQGRVKSYLLDVHQSDIDAQSGLLHLFRGAVEGMRAGVAETEDAHFYVLHTDTDKETIFLDAADPRFVVAHTTGYADKTDRIMHKLVEASPLIDRAWLPSPFLISKAQDIGRVTRRAISFDSHTFWTGRAQRANDLWEDDVDADVAESDVPIGKQFSLDFRDRKENTIAFDQLYRIPDFAVAMSFSRVDVARQLTPDSNVYSAARIYNWGKLSGAGTSAQIHLKNIALALTRRALHFPSTLADTGYTEPFIEYSLLTATLEEVSYDFGAAAPQRNRSLVSEMKGGTYAQVEAQDRSARQLTAYSKLTAEDLIASGFPIASGQNPRDHEHDVIVIGIDGQTQHVDALIQQSLFQPPLLAAVLERGSPMPTYAGLIVRRGTLRDAALTNVLGPLTAHYSIPLLIPFDLDSRTETILAAIMPIIIGAFTADISGSYITSDDILRDAIGVWPFISPEQQEAYRTRVDRVLRRIVVKGREFKGIIGWDNKRRAFHLQSLPMERAKSQARVAQLQSKATTLVGRVSGGGVVLDGVPGDDDV